MGRQLLVMALTLAASACGPVIHVTPAPENGPPPPPPPPASADVPGPPVAGHWAPVSPPYPARPLPPPPPPGPRDRMRRALYERADPITQAIVDCRPGDISPAILGICVNGTILAPVHLTLVYGTERLITAADLSLVSYSNGQTIALVKANLVDDSYETDTALHLSLVSHAARVRAAMEVGMINRTEDFAGALQVGFVNGAPPWWAVPPSSSHGIQIGVFNQMARMDGLQLGGLDAARDMRGLQIGAAAVDGRLEGMSIAFYNRAAELHGFQLGLVNSAGDARGLQLGLFNQAGRLHGVQLGLGNVVHDSELPDCVVPLMRVGF